MRFYNQPQEFYCGVDLHARSMYLCILDHAGNIVLHEDLPAEPAAFLEAIAHAESAPRSQQAPGAGPDRARRASA